MEYLFEKSSLKEYGNEVLDKYRELLDKIGNNLRCIFLLVLNNNIKIWYERVLRLNYSEELKIIIYISFVKKELVKYWLLIIEKCDEISIKVVFLIFILNSLSEYLIV